ncbi:hypothetical protein [Chenggangzhangella methanolivorans]|jgi:hypothetical protein|uniref:CopL family metal-binding regulatory protein n=2 Tax=Hyphomicrobiales TaxID=356 RepID=A0A9E6RG29_9HYPH|nr:hypothetical protein [Chenggangzhangella methanolivorans]PZQ12456.1 MAG: hypothetical protein DI565_16690 [Ancylobacter novellus]QZO00337.1 hypothetical protein K6K41_00645 [Chenggangzhangella methanolivorans]
MSLKAFSRVLAGFALALTFFIAWTAPSQAHGGHDAAMTSQSHQASAEAASTTTHDLAEVGDRATTSASASEPDCAGHVSAPDGSTKTCCSNTCHAVMSTELGLPVALSMAVAVLTSGTEPSALQGPSIFIKRPPRRPSALVG